MNLLKKRETPVQNIAYIAIMAAINVIFVLISNLLPILFVLLVFILPLTTVIVTIYCKKIYIPIYMIATIGLCFITSFGMHIFDTLIYVIPSLITGFLFGIAVEKHIPILYTLLVVTVVQFGLSYLTFYIIGIITNNVAFFDSIYKLVGLGEYSFKEVLTNILLLIVSETQILITYLIVKYEVERIGLEINLEVKNRFVLYLVSIALLVVGLISYFYFPNWTLTLLLLAAPIVVYEGVSLLGQKRVSIYISLGSSFLAFCFLFAFLYEYLLAPNHLFLISTFFVAITIIDFIFNYCLKPKAEKIK